MSVLVQVQLFMAVELLYFCRYCTDNGLMVAWAGVERLRLGLCSAPPADAAAVERHVDVLPRWPLGPTDPRSVVLPTCNKHRTT